MEAETAEPVDPSQQKVNRIAKLMKGLRRTKVSQAHRERVIAFLKEEYERFSRRRRGDGVKATEFKIKCPKCGALPDPERYTFELVEPAVAYRKLAFTISEEGAITGIDTTDVTHDAGDGESELGCRTCETQFPIPDGFWSFDIYG
jgi:hypothetical protein